MSKFWFYILSFIAFFSPVIAGEIYFTPEEKAFIDKHPVIRAHNDKEWMPYSFYRNGIAQGYTIDYLNLLAEKIGIRFEYVSGPTWDQFLGMLKSHQIDIMPNMVKTEERKKFAQFTDPILKYTPSIITKSGVTYPTLQSLSGKKVAIVEGYWYNGFIKTHFPDIEIVPVKHITEAVKKVAFSEADATIGNTSVLMTIAIDHNIFNLEISGMVALPKATQYFEHIGVRKDWPLLVKILNKAIKHITLKEEMALKEKWLDYNNGDKSLDLTKVELEYLSKKGKIKVCIDPDFMPYEGFERNEHVGISADYLKEIQKKLPVPFEIIPTKNWAESIEYAKEGKCDMLALLNKSPERSEFLDFTDPYLSDPIVIIARDNVFYLDGLDSLSGRTVSAVEGYYMVDVIAKNYPEIKVIKVRTVREAMKKVSEGVAFANVNSILAGTRAIQYYGFDNLKIAGQTDFRNYFRIGIIKNEPKLKTIMNKAVKSIGEKASNDILQHWYTVGFQQITDWRLVWQVSIAAFVCMFVLIFSILSIKRTNMKLENSNVMLRQKNDELTSLRVELENNVRKLNKLAITDKLTGLFNRVKIDGSLKEEIQRSYRYGHEFAVILMDIDHFKDINDSFGHQIGDEILVHVAKIIDENTRSTDIVGRWGGEEFIVICPETNVNAALRIAEKLRSIIEQTDFEHISSLTASFGVTLSKLNKKDTITHIISRADKALYKAKQAGRNSVCKMLK